MHINKIISINKILFLEFMTESFRECKFDIKYVNTVKSTTQWVRVKSNRIFETKCSKINQLQKTMEYKTNEQSAEYLN